jgi:hypothetical protein
MKKNFRAFCKSDFGTEDGPLKFSLKIALGDSAEFVMDIDPEIKYPIEVPFIDDDWIIQQGIGQLDKNGNEIFEGDLVEYDGRGGVAVVFYNKDDASYNLKPINLVIWTDVCPSKEHWESCKIVGCFLDGKPYFN